MESSKRKNVLITIFVITTIVAGCLAVYFGIMGNKEKKDLQAKVDELTSQNNVVNTEKSESIVKDDDSKEQEKDSKVSVVNNSMSKEELVKKFNSLIYNSKKASSPNNSEFSGDMYINKMEDWRGWCSGIWNFNSNEVEIVFTRNSESSDESLLDYVSNVNSNIKPGLANKVTGINKKIVDIMIGGESQELICPMLFLLMEDGTISYLNTKKAIQTGNFNIENNLNNLKNIVKFEKVHGPITGYMAIDIDGNSYDIAYQFISETKCDK